MLPDVIAQESADRTEADDVLQVDRISKRYGDVVALHDLSFSVRGGEIFGFVGSNGAGKTNDDAHRDGRTRRRRGGGPLARSTPHLRDAPPLRLHA